MASQRSQPDTTKHIVKAVDSMVKVLQKSKSLSTELKQPELETRQTG